jgi:hypothetical protein
VNDKTVRITTYNKDGSFESLEIKDTLNSVLILATRTGLVIQTDPGFIMETWKWPNG